MKFSPNTLRIVSLLLIKPRTTAELAEAVGCKVAAANNTMDRLSLKGIVTQARSEGTRSVRWKIADYDKAFALLTPTAKPVTKPKPIRERDYDSQRAAEREAALYARGRNIKESM